MLVIHGIWARGALCLWAEDARLPPRTPEPPDGAPAGRRSRAPRLHPFAADPETIAAALASLGGAAGDAAEHAAADELALWLPSAPDGPQAAPELIRPAADEEPGRRRWPALGCWRVPALAIEPVAALGVLATLDRLAAGEPLAAVSGQAAEAAGELAGGFAAAGELVPGGSVAYWAAVAWFADDLAARGRVLPGLVPPADESGSTWVARWLPVLTGHDARRAAEFADAMPPLCRAAEPGGEPPGPILAAALGGLTDAAARARLAVGTPGWALLPPRRGRRPAQIPVAERWAVALTSPDSDVLVAGADDEAAAGALAAALDDWRATAQAPAGPVRTCFRLVEPSAGSDAVGSSVPEQVDGQVTVRTPWRVEFALQSTEDPSLMLPADDVWAGTGGWSPGGITHPDEELLAGLGAAARLFGELDTALRAPAPADVELDTAGAFRFLTETGPMLAGAGFGVLLPDWARKARLGLKLTSRTRSTGADGSVATGAGFGLRDLVQFRYDLAVGDTTLDPGELAELARLKIPLVRIRGQWVELDERNLKAALKFLESDRTGEMPAGDVLLAGLHGPDEDLPVTTVDADGWLGDLLSGQTERSLTPLATPAAFHGKLRPYQERGLAWLSFLSGLGLGGILADDMGMGKSCQTLSLLVHEKEADKRTGPTLLVSPMSVVGNWQKEAERFTPGLAVHVHHGSDRLSGAELRDALSNADLVITTYAIAARDRDELTGIGWQRVVCDEAQNIKNAGTRQARAVRSLPAASRIALTGTPVENRLGELWSIMEFTSPGLLGPAEKFRTSFAVPVERHGDEEAADRLKRLTSPFILRRVKTDRSIISDLPDKIEMKVWCNLTPEQASLYQATVADMLARIESAEQDIERRGLVLATMAKLKQVCNHPAHLLGDGSRLPGRSGKLARLEEICDEIVAAGDKALCFTQYAEFGRVLQPYLAARLGCPVLYLHGGTAKKARDEMVASFQSLTEPAVFLLSLKAGGTGLNLTGANHVIHFDRWWNPAVEDQATDRAFRIGQRKDVQVRKFVCVGTLEERIDSMIEEKKALAERIVGTGESWLTELSTADLREVLALSPEAVSE
jgi:SNF2-related domain/SNF2 Helicase protein/Helicase conserved C-terminal domain